MNDPASTLPRRFEGLMTRLFQAQGFLVVPTAPNGGRSGADLLVTSPETTAAVELKFYRSFRPNIGSIARAVAKLEGVRTRGEHTFGILATMSRIDPPEKSKLLETFLELRIFDYDVIAMLCGSTAELAAEFDDIAREAFSFSPTPVPEGQNVELPDIGGTPQDQPIPLSLPPETRGADLCLEMKSVPAKVSLQFEDVCFRAIAYLFSADIVGLTKKAKSDTGMHEYDAIGKISSRHDFWNALISDYRSRYIVFEFKNYNKEAAQTPIYTTEKYLYPIAMRGSAIIIAREGFSLGAMKAIRGALRENGKLILPLSQSDICKMLHLKDADDDYMAVLVRKLDDMLIALER